MLTLLTQSMLKYVIFVHLLSLTQINAYLDVFFLDSFNMYF